MPGSVHIEGREYQVADVLDHDLSTGAMRVFVRVKGKNRVAARPRTGAPWHFVKPTVIHAGRG